MSVVIKIGLGQTPSGKILDRATTWFGLYTIRNWENCVKEWRNTITEHRPNGKSLFMSRNNRAYVKISGEELLALKDKLKLKEK